MFFCLLIAFSNFSFELLVRKQSKMNWRRIVLMQLIDKRTEIIDINKEGFSICFD